MGTHKAGWTKSTGIEKMAKNPAMKSVESLRHEADKTPIQVAYERKGGCQVGPG
jgi:hypothetical protein